MYYFIVNPASKSGRGGKIWNELEPVLTERNIRYHVVFSKRAGYVSQYVRELTAGLASESDSASASELPENLGHPIRLVVLGGDGTINEVLQGIGDFDKVQLGYIPAGSSNDLARDLRLPKDPRHILDIILSDRIHRTLDIGSVHYHETNTTRYFAVSGGIGFDAAVCEEALRSRLKKVLNKFGLGKLIYLAIALKQIITARKTACNIYLDNEKSVHYKKFLFIASMIHQYEGGGFKFCPGADATDGLLDICVAGSLAKPLILLALPTAFWGKHYLFPGIDTYRCSVIKIETSAPLWVHTDGEVQQSSRSVTFACHKDKLHLMV